MLNLICRLFLIVVFLTTFLNSNDVPAQNLKKSDIEAVQGEYLVQLNSLSSKKLYLDSLSIHLEQNQLTPVLESQNIFKLNLPKTFASQNLMKQLQNQHVRFFEPNYIYRSNLVPNDELLIEQWGLKETNPPPTFDINGTAAWDITIGKPEVVVAVIDTGIDYTHPDLKDNIWTNKEELIGLANVDDDKNGLVDDVYGYDFSDNDNNPFDDVYHGTHVAGIIGATADNSIGIAGIGWHTHLMALKIMSPNVGGKLENVLKALSYAQQKGVRIINASFGGGARSQILENQLAELANAGVLFIAAAGNSGTNSDINPYYPASYKLPNVISVGAMDRNGQLADFSNYGERSVHVAAPGVKIMSTLPNGKYGNLSGTSMAAPFVSGVAALLLAENPQLSLEELRVRLTKKGRRLNSLKNKIVTRTLLNAPAALLNQNADSDSDPDDPEQWLQKNYLFKLPPYLSDSVLMHEIQLENSKRFSIHFRHFDTEEGFDFVRLFDRQGKLIAVLSGQLDDSYSPIIDGDYVRIELRSDSNLNLTGFEIDKLGVE